MKNLIFSILISTISFSGFSQLNNENQIKFQTGSTYESKSRNYSYLCLTNNVIVGIKSEKDDIVVRVFNPATLDVINFKKHPIKGGNSSHYFIEDVININDHCFFFYSQWDKKKEIEQLFFVEIDSETGDYIGGERKIININGKVVSSLGYNKFKFIQSSDSSKLMIYYRKKPEYRNDKKSTDIFGVFVFDENINEKWHAEVKMPYTQNKVDNLDYQVTNDGKALMLTTVFINKTSEMEKVKNKINYRLEILKIENETSGITKYPIKLKNKLLKSVDFKELPNGDFVIGGIYSNSNREYSNIDFEDAIFNKIPKDSDGVYGIRVDSDGNIVDEGYHEFPLSFLNSYEKKSVKKKNDRKGKQKAKVKFHDNRKTIIDDDGSIICIGEQDYYKYSSTDRHVNNINYFYNDISICKINHKMELEWIKKLPKRQTAINANETPDEISFVDFKDNENLYFLYKDNIDNIDIKRNEQPKKCNVMTKGVLVLYKVNIKDGNVSKVAVIKADKSNKKYIRELISSWPLEVKPNSYILENHINSKDHALSKIIVVR